MEISDLVSAVGVSLILAAFVLATFKRLSPQSKLFFGLNFTGGCCAFAGCVMIGSVPFAVLEGTWALVAAVGLLRPAAEE